MAVQHPVPWVAGDKLHIAGLRYTYEHRVSRSPCRLGLAASFCASHQELMTVKVDRGVVHAEVDQAKAHALAVPHNQRSGRWPLFAVEGEPVELHIHGVRHLDVWLDGMSL